MTKADSAFRIPVYARLPLLFAVIIVFVYLFGLTIPLLGPDEPRYSQVAREMFERSDWITPTLGGFNWFEKPALLYWLQIGAYKLFGVSEFSARLGPALFGLGTILSLWILGRSIGNGGTDGKPVPATAREFANLLALIAASSLGIIVFARGASFDIILTFPMTAALVGFYIFDRQTGQVHPENTGTGSDSRFRIYFPLFAFYFFIGVAVLAKGLVGIVFPFAIVGFYYLLSWRLPNRKFILSLFWGSLVTTAVAATWYFPMYQRHGWEFIDEFFVQHHFQRFTSNKYFHPQPFYFFFWVLPLMTIPWLPFFFVGIWTVVKSILTGAKADTRSEKKDGASSAPLTGFDPLLRFAIAWLLVPLVFFSFSGSKLPGYILPALPPALIIAAFAVYRFIQKREVRARAILATALATFVVITALLIFVVPRFADADSVKSLIAAANESGYRNEKVLTLHQVSHNAEFYAAGRLLRDGNGRQRKLLGTAEVLDVIGTNGGQPVLVLVPIEYLNQLVESPLLMSKVLKDNGELAIAHVEKR